jgi:hypothetical protein
VNNRFGPPLTDSPLGELALLRREGSVNDYCKQFMAHSCDDPSISEEHQIQLFTSGLGKPLHTDVTLPAAAPSSGRSSRRLFSKVSSSLAPSTSGAGSSMGSVNKLATTLKLTPRQLQNGAKSANASTATTCTLTAIGTFASSSSSLRSKRPSTSKL